MIVHSDTMGYYYFRFKIVSFKTATLTISTRGHFTHRSNGKCSCYLASKEYAEIKLSDSIKSKHIAKNFELYPADDCCDQVYLPSIKFKHQSLDYDTVKSFHYYDREDSLLDIPPSGIIRVSNSLKENPNVVILVAGHSSFNEKLPLELSVLRAEKIKFELAKLGIVEGRIKTQGFGDERLLIKPEAIKKAKTVKEKEILHAQNRRCSFSIVNWDYGKSVEQLKKENEAYKNEEEE